jgi:hypothetical protein
VTAVTATTSEIRFLVRRRDVVILIAPHIIDDLVAPTGQ